MDYAISPQPSATKWRRCLRWVILNSPILQQGVCPPTKGYRLYINNLMQTQPLTAAEKAEIDALFNIQHPDPDQLVEDAATAWPKATHCVTVSSTMTPEDVTVRRIDIIPSGPRTLVVLVIASNGVVKSKVCRVDLPSPPGAGFLPEICQLPVQKPSPGRRFQALPSIGGCGPGREYSRVFTPLLVCIFDLCRQIYAGRYYVEGETNLLTYQGSPLAHDLLTFLNKRDEMLRLINEEMKDKNVSIGKEAGKSELADSSIVIARYNVGSSRSGIIGIVGPVRMDYPNSSPTSSILPTPWDGFSPKFPKRGISRRRRLHHPTNNISHTS